MIIAVCFTNFGPYHLARLRALAVRLHGEGDGLIAYEVAGGESKYPWERQKEVEPFDWITLFPDRQLEDLTPSECAEAMLKVLDRDQPDVLGIVGYSRPESMSAARWALKNGAISVLMSESQAIDRPRTWWKEMIKRRRLRLFDAALVGGPRHRDYLVDLGMPAERIALGYNAVDNTFYRERAGFWRQNPAGMDGLPSVPFFLSVCRYVPEKNLIRLVQAFARYRDASPSDLRWDLVLCGNGPQRHEIDEAIALSGHAKSIHQPGFLQADQIARLYAHAGAFVLPSLSEPWGLVVNEAASAGLPLLVSRHAGCADTFTPDRAGMTGAQFDPLDLEEMTDRLTWLTQQSAADRQAMGLRAAEIADVWGPERFADGMMEALGMAQLAREVIEPVSLGEKEYRR